jgi:hypothetical protein
MIGLEVLLAVAGVTVTVLVIVGLVLITPPGTVDARGGPTAGLEPEREQPGRP